MYKVDTGNYPTQNQGLEALSVEIEVGDSVVWGGPWLERGAPPDPWGNDYIYVFPGKNKKQGFDLYSLGEDGKTATAGNDPDDINNWDPESGYSFYPRGDPLQIKTGRVILIILALLVVGGLVLGYRNFKAALKKESS